MLISLAIELTLQASEDSAVLSSFLWVAGLVLASACLYFYFEHIDAQRQNKKGSDSAVPRGPWYPRLPALGQLPDDMAPTFKLYALNWVWKLLGLIVFGGILWFFGWLLYD